jgi:hypothetical protein
MKTEEERAEYGGRLWPDRDDAAETAGSSHPGRHQRRSWAYALTFLIIAGLVSVLIVARAGSPDAQQPAQSTTPSLHTGSAQPAADPSAKVTIYVGLIHHLSDKQWKEIWISTTICNQFPIGHARCFGSLPRQDQRAIMHALPTLNLTFGKPPKALFWDYTNENHYGAVTLGPVVWRGGTARVQAGYSCVYLCGFGTTYVLQRESGIWKVTDQIGDYWIS